LHPTLRGFLMLGTSTWSTRARPARTATRTRRWPFGSWAERAT